MNTELHLPVTYTEHARKRCQQRSIPDFMIDLLLRYGSCKRSFRADRLYFDHQSRRALVADKGGAREMKTIERWLNIYAVVSDSGQLITAGHRTKRLRFA
tara:strand:+ start:1715 stop:2014 length:300 start_codon:yes stop_codon:yes gene_type:complete